MGYSKRRADSERGANLVEFAILAPLLIALVIGIVEFSWVFAQNLGVRSGAREAARITAVDFGNGTAIANEVCARTDFLTEVTLNITNDPALILPVGTLDPGDEVTATVTAPIDTLTGLLDAALPTDLSSTVSIRIEQGTDASGTPPSWSTSAYPITVTCP